MDKWDDLTHRIQQGFLAEEPEAVMAATFTMVAEFGRTFEQISADLDRLATAAEKANEPFEDPARFSGSGHSLDIQVPEPLDL